MNTGIIIGVIIVIIIAAIFILKPATSTTTPSPTAVNCKVSDWVNEGTCNTTTGKQKQVRTITQQPQNGGDACPTLNQEINCPVACQYGPWTLSNICNSTSGKKYETNTISQQPKNGGTACVTDITSPVRRQNSTTSCDPINCEYYPTTGTDAQFDFDNTACQADGSGEVVVKEKLKSAERYGGTCRAATEVRRDPCPGANAPCVFSSPMVEVKHQIMKDNAMVDHVDENTGMCYVTKRIQTPAGVNGTCVNDPYISSSLRCEEPVDCEYGSWEYINETSGFIGRYGSMYDSHIN